MRKASFLIQRFPLSDSETVLFISNDQPEVIVLYLFLEQGVCPDDDIRFMAADLFICRLLFGRAHRTGEQDRTYGLCRAAGSIVFS